MAKLSKLIEDHVQVVQSMHFDHLRREQVLALWQIAKQLAILNEEHEGICYSDGKSL